MLRRLLTLCCWCAPLVLATGGGEGAVAGEWADERSIGTFVFRAEFPLRDVARLVQDLGELQKDIESTLELQCSQREIQIYLFRSRFSYLQYVRRNIPEGAGRQALFVAGNDAGRVYAYRSRDFETDVRHEATHALLHNALPYVPLWLDEGLAEYFEAPAAARVDGHAHRRDLEWSIRLGRFRPQLAELEAKRQLADMHARDYRDSWGWVHFMLHGPPEARDALLEFLETIPTGREPTPLSISLQKRIPDLERQVIQHLK